MRVTIEHHHRDTMTLIPAAVGKRLRSQPRIPFGHEDVRGQFYP